ncbi:hypothetical protein ACFFLM_03205 [Deinococcus oregonensis]|uniref:Uncharacterized protein n=1 Tax=Deinococcus oregonensis TaxID=1805970 RepID=A0ABV6AU11_9DEIO
MVIFGRVLLSLLIVVVTLITLYMSAYAFSVPQPLLSIGQVTLVVLAVLLVGVVWKLTVPWLLPLLLVVAGLTFVLMKQGGGL